MESLFTHQDGKFGHIHKTLGGIVLIHYIARFIEFAVYRNIAFVPADTMFLLVHLLLSWSSFIFHLPSIRSVHAPMIWPEFRAHSALFATRSLAAMFVALAGASTPTTRLVNVMATIALADLATKYYKVVATTMRDMPFPDWVTQKTRDRVNLYYSVSQVLATSILLCSPSMERAFFVLFPIQIAAFLMTLVRKRIIGPMTWHVLYAGSLGMNYLHSELARDALPVWFYLGSLLFCVLRFKYRWNKYLLWGVIGVMQIAFQNGIVQSTPLLSAATWIFTRSFSANAPTAPACLTCS